MTDKEVEHLLKITGDVFKLDVLKKTRKQDHVLARMIVMKILRDKGFSCHRIGKILNLNHSSIIHHTKDFDFRLKYEKELENKYETVKLKMAQTHNIIYQLSHDELIKYTFSLEERLRKIILSNNRNKNYEKLFKFIERNIPESNLIKAKQRLKGLENVLHN